MKTYQSASSKMTQALGESIGESIARKSAKANSKSEVKQAAIFALQGDLGAGKTTFVQGFLKGLGMKKRAQSPTFVIMRRHDNVFHIDAYRLKNEKQLRALNFNEILEDSNNIVLIEWPERVRRLLPKRTQWISFRHGKKENERSIRMHGGGGRRKGNKKSLIKKKK